ncbi:pupal cuticle protein C1B-like [Culicoides brevitarsis]|uniref:pupal cuticle protein C1B-like n=1 Tax=Culicoides brevitarsis TaxID=469753 RepID=UPI00307C62DE
MAFKFIVFAACVAFASAGLLPAQPLHYSSAADVSHVYNSYHAPQLLHHGSYSDGHLAHGIQQQNILRTHSGTISQISKQIISPHSHVSKFDTRINNDGLKTIAYAAPAISHGYAAPAISHGYAAPAISHGYAAPAISHGYAPALSHGYAPALSHGYASQPIAIKSAPLIAHSAPLAVAHHQPALASHGYAQSHGYGYGHGHVSYSSPIVNYGW